MHPIVLVSNIISYKALVGLIFFPPGRTVTWKDLGMTILGLVSLPEVIFEGPCSSTTGFV